MQYRIRQTGRKQLHVALWKENTFLDMTNLTGSIKLTFAVFSIEPKAAITAVTIWFISACSTI